IDGDINAVSLIQTGFGNAEMAFESSVRQSDFNKGARTQLYRTFAGIDDGEQLDAAQKVHALERDLIALAVD
nr:hypothetical protein [Actinomycetota bacterium]